MLSSGRGALGALAAITLVYSATAAAAQPAPVAKSTPAPKAAPATRPAPAPRPAPRYAPPPPPPENALPVFEISGYVGPGNFKIGDDTDSVSHGSTNLGFNGWGVVAQHLLIALDYDYSSAEFVDGVTLKVGRWRYGLGYIGPMGGKNSWYVKAFGATDTFDCDAPCDGTDQSGFGGGAGFIFPFERNWTGQVDGSYTHLGEKDNGLSPALNVYAFGGKVQYKFNRTVGLWAGIHEELLDSADDDSYIHLLSGRFGISIDVY